MDGSLDRLTNAPVYFAAAQVVHNVIGKIVADGPIRNDVLEAFRKLGYPDQGYLEISTRFQVGEKHLDASQPRQLVCLNSAKTNAIVLHTDKFVLQTTDYVGFDSFKKSFLEGLKTLDKIVSFDYVDSVSMRMLDAIVPRNGESLSDYLPPALLGLEDWANERDWTLLNHSAEQIFRAGKHDVRLRCVRRLDSIDFPPDVVPIGMVLLERHRAEGTQSHAVLDTDVLFTIRQNPFDLLAIDGQLDAIKKDLSQCFKNIVSATALESWK